MDNFELTTPVALIVFNRPETTQRVFAEIAKARPPKLLIIGDGPRADRPGEGARVAATRAVATRVDWPCEVLTDFSEPNLGCKRRVSSGIDWLFAQVEEAIILEDDCVPHPTFFRYCQELLDRYRYDARIGMIRGANFQRARRSGDRSYYFSKYSLIWGWASWRDRWRQSYDVALSLWPRIRDEGWLADLIPSPGFDELDYWRRVFDRVHDGAVDTWDYQWLFANFVEGRLSVVPAVNLITNIGYGEGATHTKNEQSTLADIPSEPLAFPLRHPLAIVKSLAEDRLTYETYFHNSPRRKWKRALRAAWHRHFGPR